MRAKYQGKFTPKNTSKYKGDPTQIFFRSGWELKLMMRLDRDPNVNWWKSEEVIIPYISPVDNRMHRYFPDFIVNTKSRDGKSSVTMMIEVKPAKQTVEPKKQKTMSKRYINEVFTWGVNQAKWSAAEKYCHERGWKFCLFTEKELGI